MTVPVNAPRFWLCPSPQLTVTSRIGLPLVVAAVTANVNAAGRPAVRPAAGAVMRSAGVPVTLTVTLPLAVPVVVGAAGAAGAPGAGGAVPPVLEPACAPTATVTVAAVDVLRTAVATPAASVETATCSSDPAVVENVTGAELSGLPLMSITLPVIVDEPPTDGNSVGFAVTRTLPTAAVADRDLDRVRAARRWRRRKWR